MSERVERTLPAWARAVDAFALGFAVIGLSVLLTGGFRQWTPVGRVSVRSWVRPVLIGSVLLLVRHWFYATPSLLSRIVASVQGWRHSWILRRLRSRREVGRWPLRTVDARRFLSHTGERGLHPAGSKTRMAIRFIYGQPTVLIQPNLMKWSFARYLKARHFLEFEPREPLASFQGCREMPQCATP